MKLDRTQFPPIPIEDFYGEFFLTPATIEDFKELVYIDPTMRPGKLRVRLTKRKNRTETKPMK